MQTWGMSDLNEIAARKFMETIVALAGVLCQAET